MNYCSAPAILQPYLTKGAQNLPHNRDKNLYQKSVKIQCLHVQVMEHCLRKTNYLITKKKRKILVNMKE